MTTNIIELTNLSRIFRTGSVETHAVRDFALQVKAGEFLAIEGESGSGKSTLLGILGLLDRPTAGCYVLSGKETTQLTTSQRAMIRNRHLGFVFQAFNLIEELTSLENVALPLEFAGVSKSSRIERAQAALAQVGLGNRVSHPPSQLSGGQQQRVAIARALVVDPVVILADEPTGNLDHKNSEAIMDVLSSLHQEGRTIVMVTHSEQCANRATRRLFMQDGRTEQSGV